MIFVRNCNELFSRLLYCAIHSTFFMKKIHLFSLVVGAFVFVGCAQNPSIPATPNVTNQPPSTQPVIIDDAQASMVVTFANESQSTVNFAANVEGQIFSMELPSASQLGGYTGKEFTVKTITVPDRPFVFDVTEKNTGMKTQKKLDPAEGRFVSVTFWGDKFTIEQSVQQQVRID